jgi:hypothetical protein
MRAPLGGDEMNKETVLPRRGDWGTTEQIEQLHNARAEQQKDRRRIETIDWLEEEDLNGWLVEDTSFEPARSRRDATPKYRRWLEYEMGPDPPSPTESVEGSVMMAARGSNVNAGVGKAMFALARTYLLPLTRLGIRSDRNYSKAPSPPV